MSDVLEVQFAGLADGELAVVGEEFVPAGEDAPHGEGEGGADAGDLAEEGLPTADWLVLEDRQEDGQGLLRDRSGRKRLKLEFSLGEVSVDFVQNLLEVFGLFEQVEGGKGTIDHPHYWGFHLHAFAQALALPALPTN